MNDPPTPSPVTGGRAAVDSEEGQGSLLALAVLSLVAGAVSGLVCAVFRLLLLRADRWRDAFIGWTHGGSLVGLLTVIAVCAAATAIAAWLVRRFSPYASGSGIPHVEAVLKDELPPASFVLIPVKFVGGLLAIGAGLALGREGPSVQMGGSISHLVGTLFRRNWPDCQVLMAAGAGAGLATAFNAPIAGAVFVLEELVRRFDTRIIIATCGASASAIAVARMLLGDAPDFAVQPLPYAGFGMLPACLALGIAAGVLGVAYNRAILGALATAERLHTWSVELRAGAIGAAVGLLAWYAPDLVGGGDAITQHTLAGSELVGWLPIFFLVRFCLGTVSYATGTPGGLFAPLLVLGSQLGLFFGAICGRSFPGMAESPVAFGVIGMAAFFTAVVRAPVTGIVLVIELTANYTLLLPMLAACFTAMLVPTLLRNEPIYDSLRPIP